MLWIVLLFVCMSLIIKNSVRSRFCKRCFNKVLGKNLDSHAWGYIAPIARRNIVPCRYHRIWCTRPHPAVGGVVCTIWTISCPLQVFIISGDIINPIDVIYWFSHFPRTPGMVVAHTRYSMRQSCCSRYWNQRGCAEVRYGHRELIEPLVPLARLWGINLMDYLTSQYFVCQHFSTQSRKQWGDVSWFSGSLQGSTVSLVTFLYFGFSIRDVSSLFCVSEYKAWYNVRQWVP